MNVEDVKHVYKNRVNSDGQFLPDKGQTIICKLRSNLDIWEEIYNFIGSRECFMKYYSLLPLNSYHTTIKSHTKHYPDISYPIKCFDYAPEMYAQSIYYQSTFGLTLTLKSSRSVYQKFNEFLTNMGSLNLTSSPHITLGYCYRPLTLTSNVPHDLDVSGVSAVSGLSPVSDVQTFLSDVSAINEFIVYKLSQVNYELTFSPARLCNYKDMTTFIEI